MTDFSAARSVHTSVVIPVYNKWELTEACLRSLAAPLAGKACEIIVVDNASSDATRQACPALGQALFGDLFVYHRAERNLNFGPASNLGAKMARGDFLLFLNNDTLAVPGYEDWHGKLIQDFSAWPDVAATGPVLLYPPMKNSPLGATVQHLGVFVSPVLKVGHLYEGIPANSPLAAKRRFFQVIAAACMLMPRALFLEHGGFNKGYVNGFEDVYLCARLFAAGWRMTINPQARLYHLASQTPGRHDHEQNNSRPLASTSQHLITPDWHLYLAGDDLELQVTEWQSMSPGMKAEERKKLAPLLAAGDRDAMVGVLRRFPLWHEGYAKLAELLAEAGDAAGAHAVRFSLARFRPTPEHLFPLLQSAITLRDEPASGFAFSTLCKHCLGFAGYLKNAASLCAWADNLGLEDLAGQLERWLDTSETFRERLYLPFLRRLRELARPLAPFTLDPWAYTMWRELEDLPERERRRQNPPATDQSIAFSVLMPVYNPEPKHLTEAVNSVLAQDWPHWELCLADDASPDPRVRPLLLELAARDNRIRVEFRPTNGHIAAATNTALAMARHEWIALVDQDDLLAPDALREVAAAITARPNGLLFYSDEDKYYSAGDLRYPYLKNTAWDWDLVLGQNMVSHLGVYRTDRLRAIGGFRDGFPGSQDHDMLLRYVEDLDSSQLIHIPRVLYHWRSHAGSTAESITAKPEALDSAVRAITEHLQRKGVDASAEVAAGTAHYRVRYSLPKPAPLVTLVADLESDCPLRPAMAEPLPGKAGYDKQEILLLYDQEADSAFRAKLERWATDLRRIRLLPLARALSFGERANAAARAAKGSLIGFLGKGAVPLHQDWLAEIVSRLAHPGVGVVGGRLMLPGGAIHHAGHLADAGGRLFSPFRGLPSNRSGYAGWAPLARTVPSVDPRCLFTHKQLIEEPGGFDPGMGGAAAMDFCLRLRETGRRTVITPFAGFVLTLGEDAPWESGTTISEPAFVERWNGRIAPCHPHLAEGHGGWTLSWNGNAW